MTIKRTEKTGKFKLKNIKIVFNLTVKETEDGIVINAKDIKLTEFARVLAENIFDKRYELKKYFKGE